MFAAIAIHTNSHYNTCQSIHYRIHLTHIQIEVYYSYILFGEGKKTLAK